MGLETNTYVEGECLGQFFLIYLSNSMPDSLIVGKMVVFASSDL